MAMKQVYPKKVEVEGKEVTMYAATPTGAPEIKGEDVLKHNRAGVYYVTELLTDGEKKTLRHENELVNIAKAAQAALDKLAQATERASRSSAIPENMSQVLVGDILKAAAAFEIACKPKVKAGKASPAKTFKYAHLFT